MWWFSNGRSGENSCFCWASTQSYKQLLRRFVRSQPKGWIAVKDVGILRLLEVSFRLFLLLFSFVEKKGMPPRDLIAGRLNNEQII